MERARRKRGVAWSFGWSQVRNLADCTTVMGRFWNRACCDRCRFFSRLASRVCPIFLAQYRLTARFFKLRVNRTQTKTSLFILLDSKCSLSHCCSIESWFFHIAKKLGLEKFITATQTTIAKNDIGFPTANSSPSFRLMRKLAIQDGLNPLIHGAERCSRNWRVEAKSERKLRNAISCCRRNRR